MIHDTPLTTHSEENSTTKVRQGKALGLVSAQRRKVGYSWVHSYHSEQQYMTERPADMGYGV